MKRLARIMCSNGLEGGEEECCLTQSFGCSLRANLALRHIGLPTVLLALQIMCDSDLDAYRCVKRREAA